MTIKGINILYILSKLNNSILVEKIIKNFFKTSVNLRGLFLLFSLNHEDVFEIH